MSWVLKMANGDYLHDYTVGTWAELKDPTWTTKQRFARRFYDRNHASKVAYELAIPRVVRLATEKRST